MARSPQRFACTKQHKTKRLVFYQTNVGV